MKYSIIIAQDPAGQNIKRFLLPLKVPFHEVEEKSIFCENIDTRINADIFIFATTHRAASGKPSLTVHAIGNWDTADLGGQKKKLVPAPASLMKDLFLALKRRHKGDVTIEATHHGPFLKKPVCFIEIGSSEKEWNDKRLGRIIAETLAHVVGKEKKYKTIALLGGGHYSPEANKILERTEYAIGHICPKYKLAALDENTLLQMYERNLEKIDFFVLDWKGMGAEKERVLTLLEKLHLPWKKSSDLK
mgnify:CR=1 FL=1